MPDDETDGATDDTDGPATVLVVDDQETVAESYRLYLEDDYEVVTATGGREAVRKATDEVDVVLLDRRMPEVTGDEALDRMRADGFEGQVAMVTAVDPEFDIVEMPFETYLTKPVTDEEVRETVARLLRVAAVDERTREHFALAEKRSVLAEHTSRPEREDSPLYERLTDRLAELREEIRTTVGEMDEASLHALFREIDDPDAREAYEAAAGEAGADGDPPDAETTDGDE
jgi:CheY-like chemotaxis protein